MRNSKRQLHSVLVYEYNKYNNNRRNTGVQIMDNNFFSEDDLAGLFEEIDEAAMDAEIEQLADKETDASYLRFKEIIEKHRSE